MKKFLCLAAFIAVLACGCANKAQEAEVIENDTIDVLVDTNNVDTTMVVIDSIK